MASHLLTLGQAAELLDLHVKTVRRYVRAGRLKASRIGKEYRIIRTDLDAFTGGNIISHAAPPTRHVIASSIVDVDAIDPGEGDRLTTLVMAAMNTRRGGTDVSRVDCIYYPDQARLRIMITAGLGLTGELLQMIDVLLADGREQG